MTTTPPLPRASDQAAELDKLEALLNAATPGDWTHKRHGVIVGGLFHKYTNGSAQSQIASFSVTNTEDDEPERQIANAEFCVAAKTAIPKLIALARAAIAHSAAQAPEGDTRQGTPVDVASLVNRFLAWPMPDSLSARLASNVTQPIGTHLMNADEAKAMIEHILQTTVAPKAERACGQCFGKGVIANIGETCDLCEGSGRVSEEEKAASKEACACGTHTADACALAGVCGRGATPAAHTCTPADERVLYEAALARKGLCLTDAEDHLAWTMWQDRAAQGAGTAPVEAGALTPLDYRAQGREEALAIILAESAEDPFSEYTGWGKSGAPEDEGSAYWNEDKLRELLHIGDRKHDAYDRAEAAYWEALGRKDEAAREMAMVERAPFYKPLHDFLSKHEAWDLMGDLKRATTHPAPVSTAAAPTCKPAQAAPELRGYFMRHKTTGAVGFSWNRHDPQFLDDWMRISAVPESAPEAPATEQQAATTASASEPMYQAQFDGEYGSSVWRDVTEAAYHTFMPEHRRIVYRAPSRAADGQQGASRAALGDDDFADAARDAGLNPAKMNGVFASAETAKAYKVWSAAIARAPLPAQEVGKTPEVDALMAKWDDDGATRGSAFIELRDKARQLERAYYIVVEQCRELVYKAAATGANEMTDREIMEEWDRHYLPGKAKGVPFLRTVVEFARSMMGRTAAKSIDGQGAQSRAQSDTTGGSDDSEGGHHG